MERKGSTTVAVTAQEIKAALSRTSTLTSEEEKALRMRHGAAVPDLHAPLPRAAGGNTDLADELTLIEMQLMRAVRARERAGAPAPALKKASGIRNLAKEKIIRGLRKKKP